MNRYLLLTYQIPQYSGFTHTDSVKLRLKPLRGVPT